MALWSRADRTLYTKLVYYGPAFGGKTTNLEMLHRITDPQSGNKLLTVQTANDRTLFFDLLPFDLGDILGYQVAMKLYTVPGQVRYDTTRQVVLSGADALIFIADSSPDRRDQNVWSLQNLRMNMRAKRLDPNRVPVLFQFNKQDLPDATPVQQLASWLHIPPNVGIPSVAVEGRGVLETFKAACHAMLERLISVADERTRPDVDATELQRQLDRAFAPHMARRDDAGGVAVETPVPATSRTPIVLQGDDLLERSVQTSVQLGEQLATETSRAARLEREADAFRRLSESLCSVGASFDRDRIIDSALEVTHRILSCPVVSLLARSSSGQVTLVRGLGLEFDPLMDFDAGRRLLQRMLAAGGACVVEELALECPGAEAECSATGLRAAASVPLGASRCLVAYAAQPDGVFQDHDVRFLSTVGSHLAAGLEKARLHDELADHRDRLEETVAARTEELREAYDALRKLDQMKRGFLDGLSQEMKDPVRTILSSALTVRDFKSSATERKEIIGSIIHSAEILQQRIDDLFRLVNLESNAQSPEFSEASPEDLVQEAIQIAGHPGVQYQVRGLPGVVNIDLQALPRALANLIDNAVKFSPPSSTVRVSAEPCRMHPGDGPADAMALSVLDRGPGVNLEDRERIFDPFEQGQVASGVKPAGIGIGLHEARAVARRHGGTLQYTPRKGGGSEFRLTVLLDPRILVQRPEDVPEAAHVGN